MAIPTIKNISGDGSVYEVIWTPLTTSDRTGTVIPLEGNALCLPRLSDKTVHILGTFGASAAVTLQGSNDGTNWVALTDPQGNPIAPTAESLEAVTENPRYMRPSLASGDGSTSITVILIMALNNNLRT